MTASRKQKGTPLTCGRVALEFARDELYRTGDAAKKHAQGMAERAKQRTDLEFRAAVQWLVDREFRYATSCIVDGDAIDEIIRQAKSEEP